MNALSFVYRVCDYMFHLQSVYFGFEPPPTSAMLQKR